MKNEIENSPGIGRDKIAQLASLIWEKKGRPTGKDVECWLEAETAMLASKRSRIEVFPAPEDALAPGVAIRVVSPPVAVKEAGTKTPAPFKAVRNQTPRVRPRNRTGKP